MTRLFSSKHLFVTQQKHSRSLCTVNSPRPTHTSHKFPFLPNVVMICGRQTLTMQREKDLLSRRNSRKSREETILNSKVQAIAQSLQK